MPRKPDAKTGEMRGKPQKVTDSAKKAAPKKRYGKYAKPFKKGEQLPPEQRTQPIWNEEKQQWYNAKGNPICGANRTGRSAAGPGICCQDAGWGTEHFGFGLCKNHGGSLPENSALSQVDKVMAGQTRDGQFWGAPVNITYQEAMLQEVHRTQGHVNWLGMQVANLGKEDQHKPFGHYLVDKYQEERQHLLSICKACASLGIAEKQIELAQAQGKLLAAVLQAFTMDPELNLTASQKAKVPDLLRKHLTTIPQQALNDPNSVIEMKEID